MKLALIPFDGFYESFHSMVIDDAIEYTFSDIDGNPNQDLVNRAYVNRAYDAIDFKKLRIEYAKEYAKNFGEFYNIKLEFESLDSPREYNFTTDRIYVNLSDDEIMRLYTKADKNELAQLCKDTFTSRDGFISFHDNDISKWGDVFTWDANQLALLIELEYNNYNNSIEIYNDIQYEIMQDSINNDFIYNAIENTDESKRLANIAYYLRKRQERA